LFIYALPPGACQRLHGINKNCTSITDNTVFIILYLFSFKIHWIPNRRWKST